jgi:dTDP-4-amino-4,6-dideoxygalactose transaminase
VFVALREKGIGVNLHYIPVHTQPWYQKLGFETGQFPKAEQYYNEAITLPLFPAMNNDEQNEVVTSLQEILQS